MEGFYLSIYKEIFNYNRPLYPYYWSWNDIWIYGISLLTKEIKPSLFKMTLKKKVNTLWSLDEAINHIYAQIMDCQCVDF